MVASRVPNCRLNQCLHITNHSQSICSHADSNTAYRRLAFIPTCQTFSTFEPGKRPPLQLVHQKQIPPPRNKNRIVSNHGWKSTVRRRCLRSQLKTTPLKYCKEPFSHQICLTCCSTALREQVKQPVSSLWQGNFTDQNSFTLVFSSSMPQMSEVSVLSERRSRTSHVNNYRILQPALQASNTENDIPFRRSRSSF